jgi:hypothetical protein
MRRHDQVRQQGLLRLRTWGCVAGFKLGELAQDRVRTFGCEKLDLSPAVTGRRADP